MVRADDGVDLGIWSDVFSTSKLLVPIDTHLHRIAKNVGLTSRSNVTWQTAEEVTRALARFDPNDPVKFDFPLCHMGIVQRCPSRRDEKRCEGCGVKPVCVHWARNVKRTSRVVA
jgi:endonuclease III